MEKCGLGGIFFKPHRYRVNRNEMTLLSKAISAPKALVVGWRKQACRNKPSNRSPASQLLISIDTLMNGNSIFSLFCDVGSVNFQLA